MLKISVLITWDLEYLQARLVYIKKTKTLCYLESKSGEFELLHPILKKLWQSPEWLFYVPEYKNVWLCEDEKCLLVDQQGIKLSCFESIVGVSHSALNMLDIPHVRMKYVVA
jgi:hypothetical protein